MVIAPYKRRPEPPTVAILTENGTVLDERGRRLDLDAWPEGVRCWASFDVVRGLVNEGRGEAVCWLGEEIHWRHRRLDPDGWTSRASDVHVIKLPFPESTAESLRALARWRGWLGHNGAAPLSTSGSAAWSLLRSLVDGELRCGEPFKESPPLRYTLGGRQAMGPAGAGRFEGRLELWDLPAAYASTLGAVSYGGQWRRQSTTLPAGVSRGVEWWAAGDRPTFVRCKVRIPELRYGPLPRRPRTNRDPLIRLGLGADYPTGTSLQGMWTVDELRAAEDAGCVVEKVIEVWAHFSGDRQPFARWWDAILEGRELEGFAASLAKMTGNALWGRLCMDGRHGQRTIRSKAGTRLQSRALVMRGGQPPAHDLAETVSGRVRARLYRGMMAAGADLLSAHTDGVWVRSGPASVLLERWGWRLKTEARRLDLLGPQTLRYWPRPYRRGSPFVVMSGEPALSAPAAFDEAWRRAELEGRLAA